LSFDDLVVLEKHSLNPYRGEEFLILWRSTLAILIVEKSVTELLITQCSKAAHSLIIELGLLIIEYYF
jgi:hypothetical protein